MVGRQRTQADWCILGDGMGLRGIRDLGIPLAPSVKTRLSKSITHVQGPEVVAVVVVVEAVAAAVGLGQGIEDGL
jgi:hypothetical protein